MNPPSALHGAMSRDRKPFTYTPGGLDLSEIKSERMAKRLMRNAMNQGVPELPAQPVQSQHSSIPVAVPNFNCLPVQVFPAFNLPANPKSLLRTRSNPDQPRPVIQRVPPPSQFVNNTNTAAEQYDTFNKNIPTYTQINNNRPTSMYEYNSPAANPYTLPQMNYSNDRNLTPLEISYEAEYFGVPPKVNTASTFSMPSDHINNNNNNIQKNVPYIPIKTTEDISPYVPIIKDGNNKPYIKEDDVNKTLSEPIKNYDVNVLPSNGNETVVDLPINLLQDTSSDSSTVPAPIDKPVEVHVATNNEQSEVKVVKKQTKKESKVEEHNGDENGDGDIEAELTVKLPTKKSAAKTETKVEVATKVLPDGSIEEVKQTTTKTTIDGKTEIRTKTETKIIPKEEDEEEEVEEEEEEEVDNEDVIVQKVESKEQTQIVEEPVEVKKTVKEETAVVESGDDDTLIKNEERSETISTKKVTIVQSSEKGDQPEEIEEEEVEEEEIEEAEPVTVVIKKVLETPPPADEIEIEENDEVVEDATIVERIEEQVIEDEPKEIEDVVKEKSPVPDDEEVEEEEEYEEAEEKLTETVQEKKAEPVIESEEKKEDEEESVYTDEEVEPEKEEVTQKPVDELHVEVKEEAKEPEVKEEKLDVQEEKPEAEEKQEVEVEKKEIQIPIKVEKEEPKETPEYLAPPSQVPLREPSVPLEKVEDVEIKPLGFGGTVTKSHTANTEIITSTTDKPQGALSTQTEYNRVENIVTVNRTTKTLDQSYENITQQGIPTVKSYFVPTVDRILSTPLPSRPYQSVYPPEPTTERRHSLLLERLSMERQMPTDIYQYNNQTEQQRQWSQEPQAEVLTVSNVKPSSITNQQWYQQTSRDNVIYNDVSSTTAPVAPSWTQSKPQPQYQAPQQPQYQAPAQPQYQPPAQPQYQAPVQPQYQAPAQPQYQAPAQPQYQPPSPQPQPQQYQPSYTESVQERTSNTYQQNSYSYTPKPATWTSGSIDSAPKTQPSQYSYLSKDTSDSYQNSTSQLSSSYVPPPWEQDSSYVPPNITQNYYQPPPQASTFTPAPNQGWKPTPPAGKFTKPVPTAYIPPAPNQSFVKSVSISEPPRQPGRKTYYSEYERRYISVPESTYVPAESKFQMQPDPSPQYYYDNNEPTESVEHEWRKELREFTEKSSQSQTQTEVKVKPPWEEETKYVAKNPTVTYTPTPSWSQTLRPRSWRERSFESEFVGSQEWPKTNTLGRSRPVSSYGRNVEAPIPERSRGVSVDRYNPNNYQSPVTSEHAPVQTHTLNAPAPHAAYNPSVPAYHARASAEPREQPTSYPQPRPWKDTRISPLQSRSFKYLQWITGTED